MSKKKVVVIGGGTGTYTILTGLKKYTKKLDISVIVSMMDDGGSNRIIRDEFGLLPTSDIRQCIVALASNESDQTLRKLFTHRFESGVGISGMTFGNLFMAALTDIYGGNQKKAISETCKILGCLGKIIPVTYGKTNLVATYDNGKKVLGEHLIDEPDKKIGRHKIVNLGVFPEVLVNKDAQKAVSEADIIVLGPGDFYTSILPNIVIDDFSKKILNSKAKLVYVANLMTKFGQTIGYKASDFVEELKKYIGKYPDVVIINQPNGLSTNLLRRYKAEMSQPVEDDLENKFSSEKMLVLRKDLISKKVFKKSKSDKLVRSLIRHDSDKLAKTVVKILS